jgi:hypothetical protein
MARTVDLALFAMAVMGGGQSKFVVDEDSEVVDRGGALNLVLSHERVSEGDAVR